MALKMNSTINPQQVLDKLSELLQHKNTKNAFQKTMKSEENQISELLTNSINFPYKMTYIFQDGKHNSKNTTHKAENCQAEHPELRPTSRNKKKRKNTDPETHKTSMEALFKNIEAPSISTSNLVIDCGAMYHMFHDKRGVTKLDLNLNRKITTSDPNSNLICKGNGTMKIMIKNQIFVLKDFLYVQNLTKTLLAFLIYVVNPLL
ncbi:hypothetical protein O181_123267 [Austropuccinia psidii MF-1]|uniref:Retrovirus-related Pol polyprotein from transposon TNT 1-94-like beta-barrel domain-containing protein n=1 Tax=Austropuccinia psidii MF-1 TaxID=1389203 RepID=A0A9Q3Q593_9BASI|nr:hypothetical protein [Austropuccinia psidii MF-1]